MLSHIGDHGQPTMVNISEKSSTKRHAEAEGWVLFADALPENLDVWMVPKGPVIATATVAGIQAAKRCSELIPLCHSLGLSACELRFERRGTKLRIHCMAETVAGTGVEMEALTGVSVAALTIYDMAKGLHKGMRISGIRLLSKTGGKSDYKAPEMNPPD